jgi:alpha-tubulin suppressor-like RCC1 family protein
MSHLMASSERPNTSLVQVTAGEYTTCALDIDGEVHCWGRELAGSTYEPEGSFVQISASDNFGTCAVRDDGAIVCWGQFVEGRKQDGTFIHPGSFTQVTVGSDWMCAINVSVTEAGFARSRPHKTKFSIFAVIIETRLLWGLLAHVSAECNEGTRHEILRSILHRV